MADKRSRPTRPRTPPTEVGVATEAVTGVARGGVGTAANLEETQVLRTEDLRSWAAAAEANQRAVEDPVPEPAPAAPATRPPIASPNASRDEARDKAPITASVAAAPVVAATRTRPTATSPGRSTRFAGLAGVLAVLFVVLAGAALVVSRGDAAGVGTGPAAGATPTAAPATEKPQGDGKNGCKGKGRGNNCSEDGGN